MSARRLSVLAFILVGAVCHQSIAQTTTTPSAHFGALLFPRDQPGYEAGIHLNRFTEFDKKTTVVDGAEQPIRYNGIDKTYGFNLAAVSVTNYLRKSDRVTYRLSFQAGVTSNDPTAFLQNEIIHDLRGIPHVPVADTPTQFDADVSAELTTWLRGRSLAFAGAGVALGTINQDVYGQGGFRSPTVRLAGRGFARVSGVVRAGFPAGGFSFTEADLTDAYAMAQGVVAFLYAHRLTHGILPTADWGITYSTGFFVDESGTPIDELFWTIRLSWSEKFAIETWNDSLGNKDRGPTFGVRLTTSLNSIPFLDAAFGLE